MRILIVPKKSKLQWDMDRLGMSAARVLARYKSHGMDAGRIRASHERQTRALEKIRRLFPKARVVSQDRISRRLVRGADLVIAVGGDNHFQHVSHFVAGEVMMGVNSDVLSSEGSLTLFTPELLRKAAPAILAGKFRVEQWTRLAVKLDGRIFEPLASSEIYLGELSRTQMSRHWVSIGRRSEMQKSSGVLAVTGAGSGGWYAAVGRKPFARTKPGFSFVATEPYKGRLSRTALVSGTLRRGQRLHVRSRNDSHGVVVIDAQIQHSFPEGCEAVISVGKPLRVLVGKK